MKSKLLGISLLITLASCGQQNIQPDSSQVEHSGSSTALAAQGKPTSNKMNAANKFDTNLAKNSRIWSDVVLDLSRRHPAFAGYDVDAEQDTLVIYVADQYKGQAIAEMEGAERGRKLGIIKKELIEAINNEFFAPSYNSRLGQPLDLQRLSVKFVKVRDSLVDLHDWKEDSIRTIGLQANASLTISQSRNLIELQISDEQAKQSLLNAMTAKGVKTDKFDITIGNVVLAKTLFDQFRPVPGGVNFYHGSALNIGSNGFPTNGSCSVGLPVNLDGKNGYLTAAHCSDSWGSSASTEKMFQGGFQVGVETRTSPNFSCSDSSGITRICKDADVAFYENTASTFLRSAIIKSANAQLNADGTDTIDTFDTDAHYIGDVFVSRPNVGTTVRTLGASSGLNIFTTTGPNTSTDLLVRRDANTAVLFRGLVKFSDPTRRICQGDSGGTVFSITGTNSAKFFGVISALSSDPTTTTFSDGTVRDGFWISRRGDRKVVECGHTGYFSPMESIMKALPYTQLVF